MNAYRFPPKDWLDLPNFLSAEEFKNLPPNANTCIIIEGMTYAGRHTQAQVMSEELGLPKFAFSEWVTKYPPENEEERQIIAECLRNSVYLPDDLRNKVADWALREFYDKRHTDDEYYSRPFIMVGYPRTLDQAKHFQKFLERRNIYALVAVIEINSKEARRRMSESTVKRIGHESDKLPEVQKIRLGEYFLKTHGYLKWLLLMEKAVGFKTCLDRAEYERRKHEFSEVIDRGDYVVLSQQDVSNMIMKFLGMFHFVQYSGA